MLYKCIEQVVPEARAKKLKDACRTRWMERIDSYAVFLQLLPAVNNTLLAIVNPNECLELGTDWAWDGETSLSKWFPTPTSIIVSKSYSSATRLLVLSQI